MPHRDGAPRHSGEGVEDDRDGSRAAFPGDGEDVCLRRAGCGLHTLSPISTEVVILAGGLSSRMGRDKAGLRLARRSLLGHARQSARALNLRVRVVRKDLIARCGPLGGIYTALKSSRVKAILFLACDMPFIPPALLRRLITSLRTRDEASFVILKRRAGFPFIIRSSCALRVKQQILAGKLSLQQLARSLKARRLAVSRAQAAALFNINTPEDLAVARKERKGRKGPKGAKGRK